MTLLIQEILGRADEPRFAGRQREVLPVASEEAQRRRLRSATTRGTPLAIDLRRGSFLPQHAVLYDDGSRIIVVERKAEPALIVRLDASQPPERLLEQAARVGHWAGNQHLLVETAGYEVYVRIATTPELMLRSAQALRLPGARITVAEVPFARERPPTRSHDHG